MHICNEAEQSILHLQTRHQDEKVVVWYRQVKWARALAAATPVADRNMKPVSLGWQRARSWSPQQSTQHSLYIVTSAYSESS